MKHLLAFLILQALAFAARPFQFRDNGKGSIELLENGKPVYVYNYGVVRKEGVPESRFRADYLYPVYAPDGTIVTDDFPRDHYHHRGISWMWPIVRAGGAEHDLWMLKGIRQQSVSVKFAGAALNAENGWFVEDRKVVRELVTIVAHPAKAGSRQFDLTLSFEATGAPVEIEGTHENNKGYGGLSFRFAPRQDTVITTGEGVVPKDSDMARHAWAQLEGTFQGRRAGARVDIDPANPGFPNGWCLRPYGFLGVNFPGLQPFTLERGRPLVMKYRITVYAK